MSRQVVAKASEVAPGTSKLVTVAGREIGIFNLNGAYFALANRCPHAGGPVCQGKIFNQVEEVITPEKKSAGLRFGKQRHIVCPWHGYEFDLATGCHPGDPSMRLTPVPVAVRNGHIYISIS